LQQMRKLRGVRFVDADILGQIWRARHGVNRSAGDFRDALRHLRIQSLVNRVQHRGNFRPISENNFRWSHKNKTHGSWWICFWDFENCPLTMLHNSAAVALGVTLDSCLIESSLRNGHDRRGRVFWPQRQSDAIEVARIIKAS